MCKWRVASEVKDKCQAVTMQACKQHHYMHSPQNQVC